MKHPNGRAERRFNGEVWRDRQRFKMKQTWYLGRNHGQDWLEDNNMWWARKQCCGHGNRCGCHYEKSSRKYIRKRRLGLDAKSRRKTCQLIR